MGGVRTNHRTPGRFAHATSRHFSTPAQDDNHP